MTYRNANQPSAKFVLLHVFTSRTSHHRCTSGSQTLHCCTEIDEDGDNAVGVERCMHREIVHQSTQDIVLSGRVDWWTAEHETCLSDVQIAITRIVRRSAFMSAWAFGMGIYAGRIQCPHNPSCREDETAPEHPKGHPPEVVPKILQRMYNE
jgi:hypothetical protein